VQRSVFKMIDLENTSTHELIPKNIKRDLHLGLRQMFKDMDIEWKDLKFLIVITFATVCLASVNFHYSGSMINRRETFGGIVFFSAVILGVIGGLIIVDRLDHKIPLLTALFTTSPILSIWGIINRTFTGETETPALLFALNVIFVIIAIIIVITLFIEYTTMLDRGRVIAIIFIVNIVFTIAMYYFIFNGYFALIPSIFPIFVAFLIYRQRDDEKGFGDFTLHALIKRISQQAQNEDNVSNISEEEKSEPIPLAPSMKMKQKIKLRRSSKKFLQYLSQARDFFYYALVLIACGVVVGLLIPIEQFIDVLLSTQENSMFFSIIVFISIFLAIGAFMIGLVFDFYGRKQMISLLVFVVAIVNFTNTFQIGRIRTDSNLGLMMAVLFVLALSVPLLCGDLVPPEFYGRTAIILITCIIFGFGIGYYIKNEVILYLLADLVAGLETTDPMNILLYNFVISSIVFLDVVVILFILSNIQSDLSKYEQNWVESLIHFYIVHNSGLLIHEHSFKPEEDLAESDLISGGLIGLVSMLKEITHGSSHLRIIDHGDKKLLFQWDSKEQVIFVMVIERDLLYIRYKLGKFIEKFESKYGKQLSHFAGVNDTMWKPLDELIEIYFTRKYLHIPIDL
jgi:MFS family permease